MKKDYSRAIEKRDFAKIDKLWAIVQIINQNKFLKNIVE